MKSDAEANKQTVRTFYDLLINRKDFEAARRFLGPSYVQHNPLLRDGFEGLRAHIDAIRRDHPQARSEIVQLFADGDYVIAQVHAVRDPGTRGKAIVDIFRFEDGLIVEHWDVIQEIPEKPANANTMFLRPEAGTN